MAQAALKTEKMPKDVSSLFNILMEIDYRKSKAGRIWTYKYW